jgi:hypothetical protein
LPYKPAYLLPALPFAFLLLARLLTPLAFRIVCLAIIASPWALFVHEQRGESTAVLSPGAFQVPVGRNRMWVEPARGFLQWDHARRIADMEYVRGVLERARHLDRPSVVVAHDWQPQIRVNAPADTVGQARFVYLIARNQWTKLRTTGIRIFYLAGADEASVRERGVDLAAAGARPL